MLVPVNRLRVASRMAVTKIFGRRVRGMPRVRKFVQDIPWLRHFAPLHQRLLVVMIVSMETEVRILTRNWRHICEVYFTDENGGVMAHMSTNRFLKRKRPFDVLRQIDESTRHVRYMVTVLRQFRVGASITLYTFPPGKPAGLWAREKLTQHGFGGKEPSPPRNVMTTIRFV